MIVNVLNGLAAHDDVKDSIAINRYFQDGPDFEIEIRPDVLVFRVTDGLLVNVNPDDLLRRLCKQVTSITFTRGKIQYSFVPDELGCKRVAMKVFIADLGAFHPGDVSFACPLEHAQSRSSPRYRRRSQSTISWTRLVNVREYFHPNCLAAFAVSPCSKLTSAGRYSAESCTTYSLGSNPT